MGGFYTDQRCELREIVDIGSHSQGDSDAVEQAPVRYRVIASPMQSDIGRESTVPRASFAAWACDEVAPEAVDELKLANQGWHLAQAVTPAQKAFLRTIDCGTKAGIDQECNRQELRVVRTCVAKGIIAAAPETLGRKQWFFNYQLTELGAAVVAALYEE